MTDSSGNFSIPISVTADTTTAIYGQASDDAGYSPCTPTPLSYQEISTCTGSFVPFASQLGGGIQTNGTAALHTSCNSYVAGVNSLSSSGGNTILGATEYGTGGNSGTSVILSQYDFVGNLNWTSEYAMTNATARVVGLVQDSSGNLYVGGYVSCVVGQSCSFGGTVQGSNVTGLTSNGNSNAFVMKFNSSGVLQWVSQLAGGTMASQVPTITASGIAIDSSNNVYITGGTWNTLGGAINGSHGSVDAYVAQFDSTGTLKWTSEIGNGATSQYFGDAILIDGSGNVDISGSASGALLGNQLSYTAHGFMDVFAAQFNTSGSNLWSIQIGNGGNMWGGGLQVDASNNLFLSGYTDGLLTYSPISAVQYGTHGNKDAFLLKVSSGGSYLSGSQFGSLGTSLTLGSVGGNVLSKDSSGNFYLVGETDGYLGGGCYNCGSARDIFATKISSTGAFNGWVTQVGSASGGSNLSAGITTDTNGNSYVTTMIASVLGTVFGSHAYDALIATVDSTGVMDLTSTSAPTPSSNPLFPIQHGITGVTTKGLGLVQDSSGNSYVVGQTNGNLGGALAGTIDFFVEKYNSNGNSQWVSQLGAASSTTIGRSIAYDGVTNIYAAGDTTGVIGTQSGTHGSSDIFVQKLGLNGTIVWTNQFGAAGVTLKTGGVVVDALGNTFVAGSTSAYLGGVQTGSTGTQDIFIAKFNSSGTFQWVNQIGASGVTASGNGIAIDSSGNLYIVGSTNGNIGGTQKGTQDIAIVKYNSSGAFQWVQQIGVAGATTLGQGVTVDSTNNVVVTGSTTGSLGGTQSGQHGSTDLVIASLNSSGTSNWLNQLGAWAPCIGGEACSGMLLANAYGLSIAYDSAANEFYALGYTDGMIPDATQYRSHGLADALVAKFDSSGSYKWSSQLGVTNDTTEGLGIAVSTISGIKTVMTGFTSGNLSGTQVGTHGVDDVIFFRSDVNGVLP
jgi:hypothetical protein